MNKVLLSTLALGAVAAAACSDSTASPAASSLAVSMASVYSSTPAGFSNLSTSYNATGTEGAFAPSFDDHGPGGFMGGHGPGGDMGGPGFGLGLMGGGLGGPFIGDGMGGDHFGPRAENCAFAAGTGVVCTDTTHDGLITTKTIRYQTAAGTLQSALDTTTTASVSTSVSVSGTAIRRDSSKSVVSESSTESVTGLLGASRTVNGKASGTETTTGTSKQGAFSAQRTTTDAVTGVVIPKGTAANPHPYPTAGTVSRAMSATVTISGQSPATTTRTETITYDGSATAKVVIVKDGTTQNCTLPLPHGRLTCS